VASYGDYLRDEAAKYRRLATKSDDPIVTQELLDLAATYEEAADRVEDTSTGLGQSR
jgi:hypothetical protein